MTPVIIALFAALALLAAVVALGRRRREDDWVRAAARGPYDSTAAHDLALLHREAQKKK